MGALGTLHQNLVFHRRTQVLVEHLSAVLPNSGDVLDVGCGDGTIDALIMERKDQIRLRGVDVFVRPATRIPVEVFDGHTLPHPDKSFDAIMFVDVLHHTSDPMVLLKEACRVGRRSIVLKDHTMDGPFAGLRLRFMDWVGNARHGVALPFNYWPEDRWLRSFNALNLQVTSWENRLGLYPFPASSIFDARLHFVAALKIPA